MKAAVLLTLLLLIAVPPVSGLGVELQHAPPTRPGTHLDIELGERGYLGLTLISRNETVNISITFEGRMSGVEYAGIGWRVNITLGPGDTDHNTTINFDNFRGATVILIKFDASS